MSVLGLASCATKPLRFECDSLPCYPGATAEGRTQDWKPAKAFARWAVPLGSQRRIWVKGSEELPFVHVAGAETARQRLTPPFYTAVLPVSKPGVTVEFFRDGTAATQPGHTIQLALHAQADALLSSPQTVAQQPFSLMTYGCFQPFSAVRDDTRGLARAIVNAGDEKAPRERLDAECQEHPTPGKPANVDCIQVQLRRVMKALAEGKPLVYRSFVDMGVQNPQRITPTERHRYARALSKQELPAPALVLGSGDQLYLDAAYDTFSKLGKDHPLSAWVANKYQPGARVEAGDFTKFVDTAYRAFWSFDTLESVFHSTPALLGWDDHEIRDGWGSQKDESQFAAYYQLARQAYVEHQFVLGPRTAAELAPESTASLEQSLAVGGMPVFVLDTRSARGQPYAPEAPDQPSGACPETLKYLQQHPKTLTLSAGQLCRFEQWVERVPADREFIVVSNAPLFAGVRKAAENVAHLQDKEIDDDIADGWFAEGPSPQRQLLYALFIRARMQHKRPIVISGDVHMTIPTVAWYCESAKRETGGCNAQKERKECGVLAYEMVVTGLANEAYKAPELRQLSALVRDVAVLNDNGVPLKVNEKEFYVEATAFFQGIGPNFGLIDVSAPNPSGQRDTWLHFYEGYEHKGSGHMRGIERRSLYVDWSRERCSDLGGYAWGGLSSDRNILELPRVQVTFPE
jgi:hypothetical protein